MISASYGARLNDGFPVGRFMFLRIGRVYPLHIVMLLLLVGMEVVALLIGTQGLTARQPFTETRTLSALLDNVALIDIFGINDRLSWNGPSWSIQAEIWTYLLTAFAFRVAPRVLLPLVIIAVLTSAGILASVGDNYLDRTYSWALVRCVYGFGLGMVGWRIYDDRLRRQNWRRSTATIVEIALAIVVVVLVSVAHDWMTLLLPPVFLAAVLVFAKESGLASTMLKWRLPVLLGTLSYSIYMIHMFVVARFIDVLTVAGRILHLPLAEVTRIGNEPVKVIVAPAPFSDLATLLVLALIVVLAWFSFRFVEEPCRRWSRRYARQIGAGRSEDIVPTM